MKAKAILAALCAALVIGGSTITLAGCGMGSLETEIINIVEESDYYSINGELKDLFAEHKIWESADNEELNQIIMNIARKYEAEEQEEKGSGRYQLEKVLNALEDSSYYSEQLKTMLREFYEDSAATLEEKIQLSKDFADLYVYDVMGKISKTEIDDYIAEHGEKVYKEKNGKGYYSKASNRHEKKQGKLDLDSYSYEYYGDFAIETCYDEYLNSYYEVEHRTIQNLYFRGAKLGDVGLGEVSYAAPYLFNTYGGVTHIYSITESDTGPYSASSLIAINWV